MSGLPSFFMRATFPLLSLSLLLPATSLGASASRLKDLSSPNRPLATADLGLKDLKRTEVVFAASKSEERTVEAPGTTTILTSSEIQAGGFRTLDDLLNYVRGFYVSSDRNYTYVGLRGFGSLGGYNSRVLLMVDGHRVNDNVYGQFYTGMDAIVDMEMVDHVEVIRGPASVIYGSSAVFGIINVVTKRGKDVHGMVLTAQGGNLGTVGGGILAGGDEPGGLRWTLQGSLYDSGGNRELYFPEYDDPSTNDGLAVGCDGEASQHAWLSLGWGDWDLRGALQHRRKTVPTGVYDTQFNDPGTFTEDWTAFGELGWRQGDPEEGLWTGRLFADLSYYTGTYEPAGGGPANIDEGNGAWWGAELHYSLVAFPGHKFTFGAGYIDNFHVTQRNYDVGSSPYLDDSRRTTEWDLFLQDEVRLSPELQLTLGGRYDHFSTSGGQWVPRGALIYQPSQATVLKLIGGKGFRAPSPFELYYEDNGTSQLPNPDLRNEIFQTYELDWEQALSQRDRVVVSLFRYLGEDLILGTEDTMSTLLIYRNIGKASGSGLELEYQYHDESGTQGRLSWAHQRAQDDLTGQVLPDSPQDLVKASLQVPVARELILSGEFQFRGESVGTNGAVAGEYGLVNLKAYFPHFLRDDLEATLAAYNLLDARYAHTASTSHLQATLPQDGLVVWGKLSWRP